MPRLTGKASKKKTRYVKSEKKTQRSKTARAEKKVLRVLGRTQKS